MADASPIELIGNNTKSRGYFRAKRWEDRRHCPQCGYERKIYHRQDGRYICKRCSRTFSEFTATYLEGMQITFGELSHLLYTFVLGAPGYRIRTYTDVNVNTIQRYYRLFRQAIYDHCMKFLAQTKLSGRIEMDETMFGGKKEGKRGWGAKDKQVVFGMYERNGKVLTFPVPSRAKDELKPRIIEHTKPGGIYYTDDYDAYSFLDVRGERVIIEKEDGKPKQSGHKHANGIEGFWSFAQNWMYKYRGMYSEYFHLYLKECEFRFNYRDRDLFDFIADLLTKEVSNTM